MTALELPQEISWLFLDLNSYFASVEQQLNPDLRGKPVAVVPLETDATCAIAASYEAKAYGIKTGTPIYEAKRLCKDLICVKADHERYVAFHHRILEAIDQHIPVYEVASIDEMACRLGKSQRNAQSARALAQAIKHSIHTHVGEAIDCSIGIAPNRFLAKVATELEKPNGLVVIEPSDIPHALLGLEFDDIPGIGRNMQRRLARNGVFTMKQLYALAPKHMRSIWHSVAGERMWYHLRGVELGRAPTSRRTVGHSHVLAPENRPFVEAEKVAKRLLLKAASRLRRLGYCSRTIDISIRIENGPRLSADLRHASLSDNTNLMKQWQTCWHKLLSDNGLSGHEPTLRIKKIAVTLHGLVAADTVQDDLFAQNAKSDQTRTKKADHRAKQNALSSALDTLNKRFGRNTVMTASTLGNANQVTGTKIAFSRIPERAEFWE